MNLYLDDNFSNPRLAGMLRYAGHAVTRPTDVGLASASDAKHLEWAIYHDFAVLTKDTGDFQDLHDVVVAARGTHPGVFIVREENNKAKDMRPRHIVYALDNFRKSGLDCRTSIVLLNQWR